MASGSTSGTIGQMAKSEYRNWLALGHALTTVLCRGLRPFVHRETETFYRNVLARTAGPCTCVYVPRRKPNEYHDMTTCAWANIIQAHHHRNKPNWKQSDPAKWMDPNLGPWEIAKVFLPDLGGHADIKSADDLDITGILNLMYWCNHFTIHQPLINEVRDTRNNKWVHVPKLELTNADKTDAFDAIVNLLNDPQLARDPDVQKALKEVINLKSVTDLHSMEAQILADFKKVINKEILNLQLESEKNKEQVSQLKEQQENLEKVVEDLGQKHQVLYAAWVWQLLAYVLGRLIRSLTHFRKGIFLMFLLWSFCNILDDDTIIKDGCAIKRHDDQWKLKYFDFSDFVTSSRTDFIGRQWLYREMEEVMEHASSRGVLLVGNPGSGKTAFVSNLLCSRASSTFIHDRIVGYHFCMHSDKGTQNAAKFVTNLANMVALTFVEYGEMISSDSFVRRVLHSNCPQDPEWCFQEGILTPLKNMVQQPKEPWYIVIDALDECSNNGKAEILSMLESKVRRLPKWLKLIITSRNINAITTSLDGMQILDLRSDDQRNLDDIDLYLSLKIIPLRASILNRIKTFFSITDNNTPEKRIVTSLVERAQGNFLFIKVMLDFLFATPESFRWTENFPKTLDNTFQLYFERKFGSRESFRSLRDIFEVLVAAYTPLSAQDIHSLLKLDNPDLDFEYDLIPKLEEVSLFLWHGSENRLVRIYHASLSEWLTSETNKGKFYYVKKQNGHRRLAELYLQNATTTMQPRTIEEIFYLACHIVEGGLNEHQVHKFLSLPSNMVNRSDEVKTTALHLSSGAVDSRVTELLMKHFHDVDCLDNDCRTPAFIAATTGYLKNLIMLVERGANLNHTVTCLDFKMLRDTQDSVRECKRRACEYSLMHSAAQEGNIDIVEFLIESHLNVATVTGSNNTAVQLAAENGHLEVVLALKKAGAALDGISLHHAAAGGHNHVVEYLINEGIRDDCINKSPSLAESSHTRNIWQGVKVHAYDNGHLKMRETALHAAVRNGHLSVIATLLRHDKSAINCSNIAGRRPLHEAVHLNSYHVLKAMLAAQRVNASVRCNTSLQTLGKLGGSPQYHCPCGFTPLHIAAMRGYHSVARLLITQNADINAGDCNGATPLHIASCHGMVSLLTLLVDNGANPNRQSFNGSTPLHSAAACSATESFRPLLDLGSGFFVKDMKKMTALHYIVKDVTVVGTEYFADLYVCQPKDWIEVAVHEKEPWQKGELKYSWLNALIRITKSFAASLDPTQQFEIATDLILKTYSNVFYILGKRANASHFLTGSDGLEHSSLVSIATPTAFVIDTLFHDLLKRFLVTIKKPYEPNLIPEPLTKALSMTFALIFPALQDCSFLTSTVREDMVYIVSIVLQAGADVNCQDHSGISPLLAYLHSGGRHMSKVLAKHRVRMSITCEDPFEMSVLHLISYHKLHYLHYLPEFLLGDENWSKFRALDDSMFDYFLEKYEETQVDGHKETIRTSDGPLALAIKSHPKGTEVINECFDAEGYNALHRAAQGANVVAIRKYLAWGADPSQENSYGYSPLWLAVLNSVKYTLFLNFHKKNVLTALEVDLASMSASVILSHLLLRGSVDIGCDKRRPDLTLYHIAAIKGMWQFISHLFSEKRITGLDVNCPNKHGITPMYLAMLVGGTTCEWDSPWCKVLQIIRSRGGTLQFPTQEAEYFLISSLFFWNETRLHVP